MIPALVVPLAAARAREGKQANPRLDHRTEKCSSRLFGIVNRRAPRYMQRRPSAHTFPISCPSTASGMAGSCAARAAAPHAMLRNLPRREFRDDAETRG